MIWWVIGVVGFFIILRFFWQTYCHPANTLGRQAAYMNWVASRRVQDEYGYRNMCVTRDGFEAIISYKHGNVILNKPNLNKTFKDFIELEHWIFQKNSSDEMQNCLQEVKNVQEELNNIAFDEIKDEIIKQIKEKDKIVYSIKKEDISPRTLVFLIITNVIQSILSTGQYHVYRGTLNIIGTELLKIWDYAVNQLEKSGFHSPQAAEEDRKWIREQIKNVG